MEYAGQQQRRQEETHHPTYMFRRLFLDLFLIGWRGCTSTMFSSSIPKKHYVINLYITTYLVEEFLESIISSAVMLLSLQ